METPAVPNQRLKCPILSLLNLKVDPYEENISVPILHPEDEKSVDLYLKYNREESGCENEIIQSAPILRRFDYDDEKEELDQKESNLFLEESSYIKCNPRLLKKTQIESIDRNYSDISHFKSEFIEQEEVHIKDEADKEGTLKKKNPKLTKHHCQECSYSTNYKGHLKNHSLRHKKEDEINWYRCEACPYKTSQKGNLKNHTNIHNNLMLKCSKCHYKTWRTASLKRHQNTHKTKLQCPECSYKTDVPSYLRRHSLIHKQEAFKCLKCSYQSRTKRQLAAHQGKHESMDKWPSCPLCHFKTHSNKALKAHCLECHSIDPHNPKKNEIFKCTECSYESVNKSRVKTHQIAHDPNNWFRCHLCAYKARYKWQFEKHQVQHQGENAEGWLRCLECSYKSLYKSDLRRHVILHKSADKIQWFQCSKCSYKSAQKQDLIRHQLKHREAHEIEWFCCYECGYKTKRKQDLSTHISKHRKQNNRKEIPM